MLYALEIVSFCGPNGPEFSRVFPNMSDSGNTTTKKEMMKGEREPFYLCSPLRRRPDFWCLTWLRSDGRKESVSLQHGIKKGWRHT